MPYGCLAQSQIRTKQWYNIFKWLHGFLDHGLNPGPLVMRGIASITIMTNLVFYFWDNLKKRYYGILNEQRYKYLQDSCTSWKLHIVFTGCSNLKKYTVCHRIELIIGKNLHYWFYKKRSFFIKSFAWNYRKSEIKYTECPQIKKHENILIEKYHLETYKLSSRNFYRF